MKILISESQKNKLVNNFLNEQGEMGGINTLVDYLKGSHGVTNDEVKGVSDIVIPDNVDFNGLVKFVIDNLEGGYYHPNMLKDGRVKDNRYRRSGETMFGIDRKMGGTINTTTAGKEFWRIIDNANARNTWKWNYDGGSLKSQLLNLVAQMIKPLYEKYVNQYLSPDAAEIVNNDKKLMLNFIYATWNGSGWFKKFANKINQSVKNGVMSPEQLSKIAIQSRIGSGNSLIAQSGNKISGLMSSLA